MSADAAEIQTSGCTALSFPCIFEHSVRGWATILRMQDSPLHPVPWFWIAAIWTGVALFSATQNVLVMRAEGMHHAWTHLFIYLLFSWLPSALATPIVLFLGRRYPSFQVRAFSAWAIHIMASLAICVVWAGWMTFMDRMLNPWADPSAPGPLLHVWMDKFYNGLLSSFVLYTTTLVVGQILPERATLSSPARGTTTANRAALPVQHTPWNRCAGPRGKKR
jgi:hypothetical protein